MSKLDRVIRQLEQGTELCGICGKDITDGPDCTHLKMGAAVYSTSVLKQAQEHVARDLYEKPVRLDETWLLNPEDLLYTQYFDPILVSNPPIDWNSVREENDALDQRGHSNVHLRQLYLGEGLIKKGGDPRDFRRFK